jgi:hypothetical protein
LDKSQSLAAGYLLSARKRSTLVLIRIEDHAGIEWATTIWLFLSDQGTHNENLVFASDPVSKVAPPWKLRFYADPGMVITVTRIQAQAQLAPSGCSTNAAIQISDGTATGTRSLSLSGAANDSGVLALDYAAGTRLKITVLPPRGCKVWPASVNAVVQYQGR